MQETVPHAVAVEKLAASVITVRKVFATAMAARAVAVLGGVARSVSQLEVFPAPVAALAESRGVSRPCERLLRATGRAHARALAKQGIFVLAVVLPEVFLSAWTAQGVLARMEAKQEIACALRTPAGGGRTYIS